MNTPPLLIAALVVVLAIGVMLVSRWVMHLAENEFRSDARLDKADFDIGTWPTAGNPVRFAAHR